MRCARLYQVYRWLPHHELGPAIVEDQPAAVEACRQHRVVEAYRLIANQQQPQLVLRVASFAQRDILGDRVVLTISLCTPEGGERCAPAVNLAPLGEVADIADRHVDAAIGFLELRPSGLRLDRLLDAVPAADPEQELASLFAAFRVEHLCATPHGFRLEASEPRIQIGERPVADRGALSSQRLEELLGDWGAASRLQPRVEDAVAANIATPCVLNERALLVCALARAYLGDEEEACRLEQEAGAHRMTGYGPLQDAPRVQLALHRNDLVAVESFLGEPGVRRSTTYYLSSMATHLDGLAALGERERVEAEAGRLLQPNAYLEPFALRALGVVREDASLIERTAGRFEALGLDWHAARTWALL